MELSEEQQFAINCKDDNISLVAAAGSGKTTVLSYRAERLAAQGEKVLILTFSNRAAKEIRRRCTSKNIEISTFHAFAYKHIRDGQTILSEYDIKKMLKDIVLAMELDTETLDVRDIRSWVSKNRSAGYRATDVPNIATNDYQDDIGFSGELTEHQHQLYKDVYGYYERYCACTNVIDFDDMQLSFYEYLLSCPILTLYKHILVDEYQDTDQIQYEILKQILRLTQAKSFVVGDPRQSIYIFRRARPLNLMNYIEDFGATQLFLNNNYRSNETIVLSSNNIASSKYPEVVSANRITGGIKVYKFLNADCEAEYLARKTKQLLKEDKTSSIAFLFRMNKAARKVEEAMIRHNIPYKLVGIVRYSDYADILDLLAWAKLIFNTQDTSSFARALSTLPGVGKVMVEKIGTFDNAKVMLAHNQGTQKQLSLLQRFLTIYDGIKKAFEYSTPDKGVAFGVETIQSSVGILERYRKLEQRIAPDRYGAREWRYSLMLKSIAPTFSTLEDFLYGVLSNDPKKDEDGNKVTLSTIHKSKGLEYNKVFLPGWVEGVVPMKAKTSNFEEERNIAYVGLSRAMNYAFFSWPTTFRRHSTKPSPFLETILPRSQWICPDSFIDYGKRKGATLLVD